MNSADWDEIKRLVAEALPQDAASRASFVERACGGRADLQAEVLSLLAAQERIGGFLETQGRQSLFGVLAEDALLDTQLGPYRIQSVLGRGGMGVVYRARRENPARDVALKVVRLEADSASVLRRFAAEGQILARLDHPYVARLLDAGATPDGRPYFVMELVDGMPVHRHCGDARLDLGRRLELFVKVCEAVAYAHGRLVVHRDIKPSNIIVAASGDPKLLDFGISRLLDDGLAGQLTETGLLLMTPEYASPEQVRGEPATVATDVHALGLLLHVLLTGRAPLRLLTSSPEELVRRVCLDDLPAPSACCAPPSSGADPAGFEPVEAPARLARLLRGDLDSIAARALRKEPERRYASVEQLAEDVRRHLSGLPVLARGGRWRYRLWKFVRRNRAAVALASALFMALLGGLVATAWQARVASTERARAERRFADVRRLATSFVFEFEGAVHELPGSTKARELLVKKAVEYLDDLAAEAGHDAGLKRELATAYGKLSDVQGGIGQSNLGDRAGAERSLRKAIELLDGAAPADGQGLALLSQFRRDLGWLIAMEFRFPEALAEMEQGRALAARAAPLLPVPRGAEQEASAIYALGITHGDSGDWHAQVTFLREALARLDRLAPKDQADEAVRRRTIAILGGLGEALRYSDDPVGALQALERATELRQVVLATDPNSKSMRRALGVDHMRVGRALLDLERFPEAAAKCHQGLALFTRLAAEDSADFQARMDAAHAQRCLCDTHRHSGDLVSARPACQEHLRVAEAVVAQGGSTSEMRWELIVALDRMGSLERRAGRLELALAHYRRAVALMQPLAESTAGKQGLASGRLELARTLADLHRAGEAVAEARAAVAVLESLPAGPQAPQTRRELAEGNETLGDLLEAAAAGAGPGRRADHEQAAQRYRAALDGFEALQREGRLDPKVAAGLDGLRARLERAHSAAVR